MTLPKLLATIAALLAVAAPPHPDLSEVEPEVRNLLQRLRAEVAARPTADTWGGLAAGFHAHELYAEAERCYREAVALEPDGFEWNYLLALAVEGGGGAADEVSALLARAVALRPDDLPALLRSALAASGRGRFDEAQDLLQRALQLDPGNALALRSLGEVLLALGDPEAALLQLGRAAERTPEDGAVFSALARTFGALGARELARGAAERGARSSAAHTIDDPLLEQRVSALGASTRHRFYRAKRLIDGADGSRAIPLLAGLRAQRPGDADVWYLSALADPRRGIPYLERAIALDAGHVRARMQLAALLEPGPALEQLRLAREHSPRDPLLLARLTEALARVDDLAGLVDVYRDLATLRPDDPDVRLNLGTALARQQRLDEAIVELRAAVRLAPDDPDAHYRLGVAYAQRAQTEPAQRHYAAAVRLDPDHPAGRRLVRATDEPADEFDAIARRLDGVLGTGLPSPGRVELDCGGTDRVTTSTDPRGRLGPEALASQLAGTSCVAGDYDRDGDIDLFVARGAGLFAAGRIRDSLLRRDPAGRFTDVTARAGLSHPASPTADAVWLDADEDGDLDLYVCNESRRYLAPDGDHPSQLFVNRGGGTFADVAVAAGVTNDRYCTGAAAGDYDDDGDVDLYVANLQDNRLYRNEGDGTFTDVAGDAGALGPARRPGEVRFSDEDHDGRLDLRIAAADPRAPATRLRNLGDGRFGPVGTRANDGNRRLELELVSVHSAPHGLGARIRLEVKTAHGLRSIHRTIQRAEPLTIGLGRARRVLELEILWPATGRRQSFARPRLDSVLRATEGNPRLRRISAIRD